MTKTPTISQMFPLQQRREFFTRILARKRPTRYWLLPIAEIALLFRP